MNFYRSIKAFLVFAFLVCCASYGEDGFGGYGSDPFSGGGAPAASGIYPQEYNSGMPQNVFDTGNLGSNSSPPAADSGKDDDPYAGSLFYDRKTAEQVREQSNKPDEPSERNTASELITESSKAMDPQNQPQLSPEEMRQLIRSYKNR